MLRRVRVLAFDHLHPCQVVGLGFHVSAVVTLPDGWVIGPLVALANWTLVFGAHGAGSNTLSGTNSNSITHA